MSIKSKITLAAGAVKLACKNHAPAILLGTGIVAGVACVITACKATTKVGDILDDANEQITKADETLAGNMPVKEGETYTEEDHDKDVKIIKTQTAVKLAKNYAVPAALGLVSICGILGGYKILNDRYMALGTAFNGLSAAFAKYRERVRNEMGIDADRHFRYGTRLKQVLDENGNVVDVKREDEFPEDSFHFDGDPLCYEFSAATSTEFRSEFHRRPENWQRLCDVQDWARTVVATRGHVFLNEILEQLGLAPCAAGQILGWRRRFSNDPEERFRCPDLSFGLEDIKNLGNGFDVMHMESYPLCFNCIDIAHNPKMWERDRPYASICAAHVKQRAW